MKESYVDYLLRIGIDNWRIYSNETLERFETTKSKRSPFTFFGIHATDVNNMVDIDQDFYMNKIEQIPANVEFCIFAPKNETCMISQ